MRSVALVLVPVFAGFMFGQEVRTETKTTVTKNTWTGALVDAACQSTHTQRTTRETNQGVSKTETTNTETIQCPVTPSTSTFGLLTADGKFIRFDDPSNTRIVEIVKSDQALNKSLASRAPLRVRVVGTSQGDVAIVESLQPELEVAVVGEAHRTDTAATTLMFDVRHDGDRGKLVVTDKGLSFENISDAKKSHTWTYSQIKEFKRENGNELKLEPFDGDSYEFRLEGAANSEAAYKAIADRIAAARSR